MKRTKRVCERGHTFYKSSDCPVCPLCWNGESRKKIQNDFPEALSAPALRALTNANIRTMTSLSFHTEKEVAGFHGMGPSGIAILKRALKKRKRSFKTEEIR